MMKKFFKFLMLCVLILVIAGITEVKADDEVKNNLTISNYTIGSEPIPFPDANGGSINFHVKKASNGKYVYCIQYAKTPPVNSITYTKGSKITDNGMNYILYKGYNASNDQEFFVYQTALWVYMVEQNMMEGKHNDIDRFIKYINSNSSSVAKEIRKVVNDAKKADNLATSKGRVVVNDSNVTFTLKDGYYVSSKIGIDTAMSDYAFDKYDVELTSAPDGTTIQKEYTYIIIKVPANKVAKTTTINFKATNNKSVYTSYNYTPNNSKYQTMAATFKSKPVVSDTGSVKITPVKKDVITEILKVDAATNKALAGAKLQLVNSNGKVIDTWTTTTSAKKFTNLAAETYTLSEVSAPKGYVKSNEKLVFKVDSNGKLTNKDGKTITNVVFTNKKEVIVTGVKISKQDITNNKELPGATLIIKDSNGKVVKEFVSTNKSTYFELPAGNYTLTEKIAPKGYTLSEETIKFTVKEDGTIDTVVMYNTPEKVTTGVKISKQDITNKKEVAGATLIIKDYDGNVIEEFVSGDKPKFFELKPGIYTLTEKIAPEGYILSEETITFTVEEDGTIDTVVMYNTPNSKEIEVENTASFKTMTATIIGLVVSVLGSLLIFKKPKQSV